MRNQEESATTPNSLTSVHGHGGVADPVLSSVIYDDRTRGPEGGLESLEGLPGAVPLVVICVAAPRMSRRIWRLVVLRSGSNITCGSFHHRVPDLHRIDQSERSRASCPTQAGRLVVAHELPAGKAQALRIFSAAHQVRSVLILVGDTGFEPVTYAVSMIFGTHEMGRQSHP